MRGRPGRPRYRGDTHGENWGRPWTGGCSQGWLTLWSGRRPRCPRAPLRPGAAGLPCSRGLGPRSGDSAISERTLRRSRAQLPLPPGGEAARCGLWRRLGSARSLSLAAARPGLGEPNGPPPYPAEPQPRRPPASRSGARATEADPLLHAGWHSLQSVGAGPRPRPSTQPREGRGSRAQRVGPPPTGAERRHRPQLKNPLPPSRQTQQLRLSLY